MVPVLAVETAYQYGCRARDSKGSVMQILICPRCGAELETDIDDEIAFCVDCDCTYLIEGDQIEPDGNS